MKTGGDKILVTRYKELLGQSIVAYTKFNVHNKDDELRAKF